jgi:hypothetical protein
LLIACLSALLVAAVASVIVHDSTEGCRLGRDEGDPADISAPLPMPVKAEQDVMTERELDAEQRAKLTRGTTVGGTRRSNHRRIATASRSPAQRLANAASASCDSCERKERRVCL